MIQATQHGCGVGKRSAFPPWFLTCSQAEFAQSRMVIRSPPQRPVELALGLLDRQIVDAGVAAPHQAVFVEFPVLVAVGPVPIAGVVAAFVSKPYRDPSAAERPQFLA